jgi:hypothetical protein
VALDVFWTLTVNAKTVKEIMGQGVYIKSQPVVTNLALMGAY